MKLLAIITCCILAVVAIFTPWRSKPDPFVTFSDTPNVSRDIEYIIQAPRYPDTLSFIDIRVPPDSTKTGDNARMYYFSSIKIQMTVVHGDTTVTVWDSNGLIPTSAACDKELIKKLWR